MAAEQDEEAPKPPRRIDGPTPNGGVYSILYTHDDGSKEGVEFDADDNQIWRTYFPPPKQS
jgi:hypothetical protein